MTFIKVSATSCNVQGNTQHGAQTVLYINPSLVTAIRSDRSIGLTGGATILHVSDSYYTNIRLHESIDINNL